MAEQKRGANPWWSSGVAHAVPITTGIVAIKKLNTARPQKRATSGAAASAAARCATPQMEAESPR